MTWMRLDQTFRGHRKVARLARALRLPQVIARGMLVSLWTQVLAEAPDGSLEGWDADDLLDATGASELESPPEAEALLEALVGAGWIDREEGEAMRIHDWSDYSAELRQAQQRAREREKKRRQREDRRPQPSPNVPGTTGERPQPSPYVPGCPGDIAGQSPISPDDETGRDGTGRDETRREIALLRKAAPAPSAPVAGTLWGEAPEVVDDEVERLPAKPKGASFSVRASLVRELEAAFPSVDVLAELREIRLKCTTDPAYIKTVRGWPEALRFWCSRAQRARDQRDAARPPSGGYSRAGQRTAGNLAAAEAFIGRGESE